VGIKKIIYLFEYMSKFSKTPVRINVQIEEEFRKKYKLYCLKNDIVMSDRIRELILKDLKGEIK
jgi:hypothetical protein